jgi:membrane-associated phospholipid phosphatase
MPEPPLTNTAQRFFLLPEYYKTVAVIAAIIFTAIAIFVFTGQTSFDKEVIQQAHHWENERLTKLMQAITFLGNHQFLIPANLLLIAILVRDKQKRAAVTVLIIALTSLGFKFLLKELFHRPRPDDAMVTGIKNFSFPSGHAMLSLAFYGLLILLLHLWVKNKMQQKIIVVFLLLLILLIGFSRIYLRVHYPTDVVAGYFFEIGWVGLLLSILQKKTYGLYTNR